MNKLLAGFLIWFALCMPALAATETIEVYYLPLHEAADAAQSQLSDTGKVAAMPSRRMLIIDDDQAHLKKALALLQRLDHPPGQYTAYLTIEDIKSNERNRSGLAGFVTLGHLSGGWVQVKLQRQQSHSNQRQSFQLRISSNQPGSIEAGTIQSFSRATRLWLSGYGVVQANSVTLVPVTSGFRILVSPAGTDQVRVRIVPWVQRIEAQLQGQHELLLDLGTSSNPATPPSNSADMRLNARPVLNNQQVIEIAGAATELTIPLDESVTIAASNLEAEKLGNALLSRYSNVGKRQIVMRLRVSKSR